MATIFLSYRRTDSPQACRVYEWLVRRFGKDAVFMDVTAIPLAVDYADYIRKAIMDSRIMIVLIGTRWMEKLADTDDPVRLELELALENKVPLMPLLIGNTTMPDPEDLPASIAAIAYQNAITIGVSHDFHTHMQTLLPKLESILRQLAVHSQAMANPDVIYLACHGVIEFLKNARNQYEEDKPQGWDVNWEVVGTTDFIKRNLGGVYVTLFLHRVVRLDVALELHFILSFWGHYAIGEQHLAGWVIRQIEQSPILSGDHFAADANNRECVLKIRRSDEDPRQIWQMITDEPLRLALAYVATVSPQMRPTETANKDSHDRQQDGSPAGKQR